MSLRETLATISHREYLMWMEFFEQELNAPSRSDFYLMQLTREVVAILAKHPEQIKIHHFRLQMGQQSAEKSKITPEQTAEWRRQIDKSMKMASLGLDYYGRPLKKHR